MMAIYSLHNVKAAAGASIATAEQLLIHMNAARTKYCQMKSLQSAGWLESFGYILDDLGRETGPKASRTAVGFIWVDSQDLATILEPFRTIVDDFGPDFFCRNRTDVWCCDKTDVFC